MGAGVRLSDYKLINNMKNTILTIIGILLIGGAIVWQGQNKPASPNQRLGMATYFYPISGFATSSRVTVTTTSQRLLSTTTGKTRVAATFQAECPAGSTVYYNLGTTTGDMPAVARGQNNGGFLNASTTALFSGNSFPIRSGSVQAVTDIGTCFVYVSDWQQ